MTMFIILSWQTLMAHIIRIRHNAYFHSVHTCTSSLSLYVTSSASALATSIDRFVHPADSAMLTNDSGTILANLFSSAGTLFSSFIFDICSSLRPTSLIFDLGKASLLVN